MPLAAGALGTTTAVKGSALEEGATQNITAVNERGSKLISFTQNITAVNERGSKLISFLVGPFSCHLYRWYTITGDPSIPFETFSWKLFWDGRTQPAASGKSIPRIETPNSNSPPPTPCGFAGHPATST